MLPLFLDNLLDIIIILKHLVVPSEHILVLLDNNLSFKMVVEYWSDDILGWQIIWRLPDQNTQGYILDESSLQR